MNIIYTPSHLLKEVKFKNENLPVVIRVNKFDEKAAEEFSKEMARAQNTGQPVVPVIIDSYGGQVYSLMSMISDIQHSRLQVATIVQGKAMSCGAILFSFGVDGMRYMDPDATVMIHDVSSMAWGKVEEIKHIRDIHKFRARGNQNCLFIDFHLLLDEDLSLKEAHKIGHDAEEMIKLLLENYARKIDVTVHVEPYEENHLDD